MNNMVVFLMGPTASGKSGLAELLSERLRCRLISVDSSAVYRGMDIGSAKPDKALLARIPHQLIDIRDPQETYSAADFVADAQREIQCAHEQGELPLLVGGTMLYFKALRDGLAEMPAADPKVRAEIEALAAQSGWQAVHDVLSEIDPESAERIHPNDPQRLQRALEVYRVSGVTMTELHQQQGRGGPLQNPPLQISIQPVTRALLHERIEQRFDQMLELGLIEEVQGLLDTGLALSVPPLRAVGYRQVMQFLHGELDYQQMRERGVIASRQLAKRQLTWLRGWKDVYTLQAADYDYSSGFTIARDSGKRSIIGQALQLIENFGRNQ
ncbi:MAG: tRNA (adenosine(37)-N6)-dimethylallyltransferase MiaA [Pseudomonadota bacterium]